MIAIIDYGVGNLFSLQSSLKFIGADAEVTNDIAKIKAAGYSFLTGVSLKGDRNPFEYGALRMYVLLKEFVRLPRGLAGSNGIVLMVPKDMRVPDNNDGHNDFYRVDLPASEFWADK